MPSGGEGGGKNLPTAIFGCSMLFVNELLGTFRNFWNHLDFLEHFESFGIFGILWSSMVSLKLLESF